MKTGTKIKIKAETDVVCDACSTTDLRSECAGVRCCRLHPCIAWMVEDWTPKVRTPMCVN